MKNSTQIIHKLFLIAAVSIAMIAGSASADQAAEGLNPTNSVFISSSYLEKSPFTQRVFKTASSQKTFDDSPVYLKWKAPFSRHQFNAVSFEHTKLIKLAEESGSLLNKTGVINNR